jgi:hypothetical protein
MKNNLDSFWIIYLALKRAVSFSVRTTLNVVYLQPCWTSQAFISTYLQLWRVLSVILLSVSGDEQLLLPVWLHTHRTCFWFLLPWLVVNVVCNENSSCRLFWLCRILFVTDLDVWSGVWSVHRIYGIHILQCTMTVLDLYRSCRTWLFTNVLNQLKMILSGVDALYIYFFTFTLCQIQCSVKVKANSVG